jgi:GT2 family glycosyltransferase
MKKDVTIGAIIVSHNGLEHLKTCIEGVKAQSFKVTEILVVNNGSTDGTKEWLESLSGISFINQENLGSSGGQFSGMSYFFKKGYNFIWSLDHDIIPREDTLEKLLVYVEEINEDFGFLTSCMLDNEGKIAWSNIPELEKPLPILTAVLNKKPIPVLSASFGSLLLPVSILGKVGLPCKKFFIWGDDAEFTLRMIRAGYKGYMVMDSNAIHNQMNSTENTFAFLSSDSKKLVLGLRNMTYVNILRNKIVYHSSLRGYLSAWMYFVKIVRARKESEFSFSFRFYANAFKAVVSGVFLKPEIEFPQNNK